MKSPASAKLSLILYKSKKLKEGRYPVMLRIYHDGKTNYISTGEAVTEEQWDEEKSLLKCDRRINPDVRSNVIGNDGRIRGISILKYEERNEKLTGFKRNAEDLVSKYDALGKVWSFQALKRDLLPTLSGRSDKATSRFLFQYNRCVEDYKNAGKSVSSLLDTLSNIRRFCTETKRTIDGDNGLSVSDIDVSLLNSYVKWMKDNAISQTTIGIRLRNVRIVLNRCYDNPLLCLDKECYPFGAKKVCINKFERTSDTRHNFFLTADELRQIRDTAVADKSLERARHLFLLQFFGKGINYRDLATLKRSSIKKGVLTYSRSKTGKKYDFLINADIQRELDFFESLPESDYYHCVGDYLVPIILTLEPMNDEKLDDYVHASRSVYNKQLKRLFKTIGLSQERVNEVSSYMSRHSFAMRLLDKGLTLKDIQEHLGHSNPTTTLNYLKQLDTEERDMQTRDLI